MDKQRTYYRKYRKARDKALSRLASAYPNQYKKYLEEEKANELVKANDSGRDSNTASLLGTRASGTTAGSSDLHHGEDEGDRGGEA